MPMLICGSDGQTQEPVTLYYHGEGGKGFVGRTFAAQVMLMEKGIKFEQKGFDPKVIEGCFAVPMITIGEGDKAVKCSQTVAIAETLGRYLDLMPENNERVMAKACQLNCDAADYVAEAFSKAGKDPKWPERMAKWMAHFENCLKGPDSKGFFLGATPTYVDFHVLHPMEMMDIASDGKCFGDCENLKKWFDQMIATEGYKGYLANKVFIAESVNRFKVKETE